MVPRVTEATPEQVVAFLMKDHVIKPWEPGEGPQRYIRELKAEVERLKEHVATLQELRELDRVLIAKLRAEIELVSK